MTAAFGPDPRADLGATVASLLRSSGHADLAAIVDRSQIERCPSAETWQLGDRAVTAERFGLVVASEDYVRLDRDPEGLSALRSAFASAVRSFETELTSLDLFLAVGPSGRSWASAYRSVPVAVSLEPEPEAVRGAAIALAEAYGRAWAENVLQRSTFDVAPVPYAETSLRRWVVRLVAADFVDLDQKPERRAQLEAMITAAAASPTTRVGEIVFGARA